MINYYQILGVESDSSAEDIKHAYKRMIRLSHPDTEGNDSTIHMAQIINEAYKILSNTDKKTEYDLQLANENNSSPVPRKSQTTNTHTRETQPPPDYSQPPSGANRGGDYDDYLYTGTIREDEPDDTEGPTRYFPPLDTLHLSTAFTYIKLSIMALWALIQYSKYSDGKRGKTTWSVTIGISVIALAIWGGLIGFVLANPETSIEWWGSSLSVVLWLVSWILISLRSASAASKLSYRLNVYKTRKKMQNKFGTAFTSTQGFTHSVISGMWVLLQAVALMFFAFAVTSGVWLRVDDKYNVVTLGMTLLIIGWALTVFTSFVYSFKIENKRE